MLEEEIQSSFLKSSNLLFIHLNIISMMTGSIKTLTERGFGFISVEGQEKEIFFHSSALVGVAYTDLKVGDIVTFDTEDSDRGPRAVNVKRA